MAFSNTSFLIILSIFFLIYFFLNKNEKFYSIIIFGFFILLINSPLSIISAIIFIIIFCFFYYLQNIFKFDDKLLIIPIIFFLIFFKYKDNSNFFLSNNAISYVIPLGISFYVFQGIIYVLDYGTKNFLKNFKNFIFYIFFFPQLIAGPLCNVNYILNQINKINIFTYRNLNLFFFLFSIGYLKKVLFADNIRELIYDLSQNSLLNFSLIIVVFFLFYLQIFFDFSGYMNMARGIAKLFNINLPLNFKSPYLSDSPSVFFERWHITLSSFIKTRIFTPLSRFLITRNIGINKSIIFAMFTSLILFGIWHGLNIYYVTYGFLIFLIFIIWKILRFDYIKIKFIRILIVQFLVVIFFGFVYLGLEGLPINDSEISVFKNLNYPSLLLVIISTIAIFLFQIFDEKLRNSIKLKKIMSRILIKNITIFFLILTFSTIYIFSIIANDLMYLHEGNKGFIYFNF